MCPITWVRVPRGRPQWAGECRHYPITPHPSSPHGRRVRGESKSIICGETPPTPPGKGSAPAPRRRFRASAAARSQCPAANPIAFAHQPPAGPGAWGCPPSILFFSSPFPKFWGRGPGVGAVANQTHCTPSPRSRISRRAEPVLRRKSHRTPASAARRAGGLGVSPIHPLFLFPLPQVLGKGARGLGLCEQWPLNTSTNRLSGGN